jgi:hypothetical protein
MFCPRETELHEVEPMNFSFGNPKSIRRLQSGTPEQGMQKVEKDFGGQMDGALATFWQTNRQKMQWVNARILQTRQLADRFSYFVNCSLFDVLASYCCFSKLREVRKRLAGNCRKSIFAKTYTAFKLLKKRDLCSKPRFFTNLSSIFPVVSNFP